MPLKHPKAKGTRLENEVVEEFIAHGCKAVRMWGSNGESRGLKKEVDVVVEYQGEHACVTPFYIQCKSVKKLSSKFVPTEGIHAVVYKENRGRKFILLELETFCRKTT